MTTEHTITKTVALSSGMFVHVYSHGGITLSVFFERGGADVRLTAAEVKELMEILS